MKIKAAIYARVSKADQDPDAQLFALRDYAAQRGFAVYKEYVDYVSGNIEKRWARSTPKDQAFQDLMADVKKRRVDCVMVWKYDRFARSLRVLVSALHEFNILGVDFISYTQNIDTTTPTGRLFYHVIASFAEFERELIEAAERLNVRISTVRMWIFKKKLRIVKLGRAVRIPSDFLDKFIEQSTRPERSLTNTIRR